jgi:putative nucleotidyltransferase with HDIG domain
MSLRVRIYVATIGLLGWAALFQGLSQWHTSSWSGFVLFAGITILASGFKIRLPGVTGTVSAAFLPVLIGIVCRSLPENLVAACGAVLIQCVWHSKKKPDLVKVVFNVASVAIAVASSTAIFYSPWLLNPHFEFALRLAILGVVYFVANTLPVAGVISLTEKQHLWTVWRDKCFWSFPHYLVGAAVAGLFEVTKNHLGWQTALLILPVIFLIYRTCQLHLGRIDDARVHAEETAALHLRTVTSLALAIEAKDQETHDHLQRVQVYATEIGKELKLSESEQEALHAAALLHDIGKIAVPDHIINKPGKLTPDEFLKMKIHPVVGAEILERVRFPFPVAPIVRCHHEKWDGSGYPAGLKGEEIPIGARILTAVDCLDALASNRQYRRALPLHEAMAVLERESGKAFDPQVVAVLKRRYIELEDLAKKSRLDVWRLSTDIHVEKGAAPDAGFADMPARPPIPSPASTGEVPELIRVKCLLEAVNSGERFLGSHETLPILAARLAKIVAFDSLAIYVPQAGRLLPVYAAGAHRAAIASLSIPLGQGVSGWSAEASRPIVNGNPAVELAFAAVPVNGVAPGSALALPLPGVCGTAGVLTVYAAGENAFDTSALEVMASFAPELGRYLEKNSSDWQVDSIAAAALAESIQHGLQKLPLAAPSVLIH